MTNTQQAIARLMGEDLYVWCAYPGHGNGKGCGDGIAWGAWGDGNSRDPTQ
jgi:hypothetical protein